MRKTKLLDHREEKGNEYSFDERLNQILDELQKHDNDIVDIKFHSTYGSYIHYYALIIYEDNK